MPHEWSHGEFYWNELMTRDGERAKKFYADTLGWNFEAMKISEFSTSRSAIAVAMVVLKRMLPQSENAVLVVMIVERFWLWRVEIT